MKSIVFALLVSLVVATIGLENYPTNSNELEQRKDEKAEKLEYRLPKSIVPNTYDLKLTDIDFVEFSYKGTMSINVTVVQETNKIVLHRGNLTVDVNSVLTVEKEKISVTTVNYDEKTEKLTIELQDILPVDTEVSIALTFNGTLRDNMNGFYRSSYYDNSGEQKWLASTQFEATSARHAFPCFDEPALKAKFKISIQPPKGYGCLSNMPSKKENTLYVFDESEPMSTYLVAFLVSDFKSYPETESFLKLWARPNAIEQAEYGQNIGVKAVEYFEDVLNEKYTLPKMDMAAIPDFAAGAMENWGLLTYRETASLYDENHSSAPAEQRVASVIVHEVTHMWFGDLVTPEWWSYLWMSEAFARFYQYFATHHIKPEWKMDQQFVVEQIQTAFGVDGLEDSVPMTRPEIESPSQIGSAGGTITYNKGASIVRMMKMIFGTDVFNAALKEYIQDRKFKSTKPEYLWKALQKQVDASNDEQIKVTVETVMKTWTEQSGFPYISVSIKPDYITFSQERFFLRNSNSVPNDANWWVPITLARSSSLTQSTKPVYWLSEREGKIENLYKDDDWIIFNVQSAGFYRVNYDKESWNKIINVLKSKNFEKIDEINRAAIVDDLLNLARAELLDYETAMRGIQYLRNETNYLPFKSAFNGLVYLIRKFSDSPDYNNFKEHVLSLITNIYKKLGYNDRPEDDQLTILLRQAVLGKACQLDYPDCVSKSMEAFSEFKEKQKPIPKNQRAAAYCTAMRHGTEEDWEFLWNQFQETNVAAEETIILNSLGCTRSTKKLEQYLLSALTPFEESRIRKQDQSSVFSSVYSSSLFGAEYVFDFVQKHHAAIHDYHESYDEIGSLISSAVKTYPTKTLMDKLTKLMDSDAPFVKEIKKSLEKSSKFVNSEIQLSEKYSPIIIGWIRETDPKNENTIAYRLPDNITPNHYVVRLTPDLTPGKFDFEGRVEIHAKVTKSTNKIVLHTDQLNILETSIWQLDESKSRVYQLKITDLIRKDKYHFTSFFIETPITAGTLISIEINYTGQLNTEMRGFYRSSYKKDGEIRWLAATHLEPVGARRVFPCFDEPALKATFDIIVKVPDEYRAISNMGIKSENDNVFEFNRTPLMSTYLVAVVVSDFSNKTMKDEKHEYSVLSNPLVAHQLDYSLEVMAPIVKFFESKLGHDYSLPKMDMIALPDFASGAMENWGLLTYRETNMLYDPKIMSTLANKQSIRNVIAHEITHQWFGDLVSPAWWNYLWLSEGFARYFQCHAYSKDEASWNLETQFVVDHLQTSFSTDASTSTHPVTHEVYSPSEIRAIFDKISYAKAASLIRMLEKLTGSEIFYAALYRYLDACKMSTGTPEILFTAFQTEIDSRETIKSFDVTKLMNSWTKKSGFPVINVIVKDNELSLEQKRFYLRPHADTEETWIVPITWATESNPNFDNINTDFWLNKKNESVKIKKGKNDWVILNVQQTGYYRVNYDVLMWGRIIAALKSEDHSGIHEINRANIIDDLLNLGRAGHLDYDVVMSGISYLKEETEYAPWKAAFTGLTYLNRRFAGRPEIYNSYKTYLMSLLESNFKRLGMKDVKGEKHTDTLLRKFVLEWLCQFGHNECVNEAVELFKTELNTKLNVAPNQRDFVYCTAIRHGTTEDWNYLWDKMVNSDFAAERLAIMSALACSKDETKLKRLLEEAITPNSEVRFQDVKKIFTNVVDGGLIGVDTTLDFIEENFERIVEYLGDESIIKSTISTISKRVSSDTLLKKFDDFVQKGVTTMPSIAKSLQSSLKRANLEMSWFKRYSPNILVKLNKENDFSEYRLPTFAKPEAYDIYLKPYFEEKDFIFEGKVFIDIKIEGDTDQIILNQHGLVIEEIRVAENDHTILKHFYNPTTQRITILFQELLRTGEKLRLEFKYSGVLRDDMRGFYKSSYVDENGNTRWLASTQFEPTYARRAFPCFDEPSFKATFTIHIAKPEGYHTLSNKGSKPSQHTDDEGTKWDDYEPTLKMSSYLVAFVVSDFVKVPALPSKVSTWSRSQLKDYMNYATDAGDKALKFLSNFTKIDYPLSEMNFVSVPDFDMGAMENWGLVTFREYGLTYNIDKTSASYKKYVNTVVSHELVHMWFGNLVTCEWWDYTWLNEGFAEYISYLVSDASEPSWKLLEQFVVQELQVGLNADATLSSHPMNNKVLTPNEAQDGFDKIAYQKSASVLRMLHHSFGQQIFVEALRNYLDANKYSVAKPEHLSAAIQAQFDEEKAKVPGYLPVDIATVMNSWTSQSGYPVIKTSRLGSQVTLSQERFLLSSSDPSEKKQFYWVPITYTSETKANFEKTEPSLWLNDQDKGITISSADKWYLLNIQEIGFYRVHYDKENWAQLSALLNSNNFIKIPVVNRAQIVDDALNLARAGYLDYEIALGITSYLSRETSYLPWLAFFNANSYLNQRIEARDDVKKLYTQHVLTIIEGVYKKLGFNENMKTDAQQDQVNRELILNWACKYGHKDCLEKANVYAQKESITPNIAGTVYCTAMQNVDSYGWDELWNKYLIAPLATDYITMLKGLGCSRNATILERYLNLIVKKDSKVRRQDVKTALSSIYSSSQIGFETTLKYFENNLDKLHDYFGNWHDVGSLFSGMASHISKKDHIDTLERLASDSKAVEIKSSLESAVKTANSNLKWFDDYSIKIYAWLDNTYNTIPEPPTTSIGPPVTEGGNEGGSASTPVILSFLIISLQIIMFVL